MRSASHPREPTPRRRRAWRWLLVALLAWWAAGLGGALIATAPRNRAIAPRWNIAGRGVEEVAVRTGDGVTVRGWLVQAREGSRDCVVLAAGIHGNRLAMVSRAEWYLAHGWSTLLVDLRGTGASDAVRIAMGFYEANDLLAWREWLRGRGFQTIGAHGQSLGAAAIVFGDGAWTFAVLEACYADLGEALQARLPWLPWQRVTLWPLRCATSWLLGVDPDALRPVDRIAGLRAPVLFLCGDADAEVGPDGAARLLAACGAADKRLVTLRGAGHVDLLAHDGEAVRNALAAFVPPPLR